MMFPMSYITSTKAALTYDFEKKKQLITCFSEGEFYFIVALCREAQREAWNKVARHYCLELRSTDAKTSGQQITNASHSATDQTKQASTYSPGHKYLNSYSFVCEHNYK